MRKQKTVIAASQAISERRLLFPTALLRKAKQWGIAMTAILALFLFSAFSFPQMPPQVQKLKRGISNAAFGWLEIPKYMIIEAMHANPEYKASLFGVIYGPFKGAGHGALRMLSGAYDIVTFPINYPANQVSLVAPDYFTFEETE